MGLSTLIANLGQPQEILTRHDFRSYSALTRYTRSPD